MNRAFSHLCLFGLLLFSLLQVTPAQAHPLSVGESAASFTFDQLGENDIVVKSIYEQVFVDFPFVDGLQAQRAVLRLHLSYSPKLLPELSELIIALNDEPVANLIFTPEQAADTLAEIELPLEALRPGENELLLRFKLRLVRNGCDDVNSPDLWAKIFSDSSLSFEGSPSTSSLDLSRLPLPFSTYSFMPGSPQISIILPPNPTAAELTAAAQAAAALGQASDWKKPPLWAFTADHMDAQRAASDALIVIDTSGRNPLANSAAPGLTMLASPLNPGHPMLVLSGKDDMSLLQTAAMLATQSARTNWGGTHVNPQIIRPQPVPETISRGSFSDFGLEPGRVRGIGLHDLYYPMDIPFDWKPTSDAQITLEFGHGRALTSASLMIAYVNGFEVAQVRLDSRNAENGRLVIQLSPRQIHLGRNWLHLSFDLHMPRENCKYRYFEEAWAEISATGSTMNLAHVSSEAPLELRYMPSHLVSPQDLGENLFVLPANPQMPELTALVRMAAKLGTYSHADYLALKATTADRFDPKSAPADVIAIGIPETNALIAAYDAQLPQPLSLSNGQIVPPAGRDLLPEELSNQTGYLELLTAPWSPRGSLVVISARQPELLYRVVDILPSVGRSMKLQGNVAVVTAKTSQAYSLGALAGLSLSPQARILLAALLIGSFFLIGIVGFVVARFRRTGAK